MQDLDIEEYKYIKWLFKSNSDSSIKKVGLQIHPFDQLIRGECSIAVLNTHRFPSAIEDKLKERDFFVLKFPFSYIDPGEEVKAKDWTGEWRTVSPEARKWIIARKDSVKLATEFFQMHNEKGDFDLSHAARRSEIMASFSSDKQREVHLKIVSNFYKTVIDGEKEIAYSILKEIEEKGIVFDDEMDCIKNAFIGNCSFLNAEFNDYPIHLRNNIYKIANLYAHLDLVFRLNDLGMEKPIGIIKCPAILSPHMDIVCAKKIVQGFLTSLREDHLLLTKEEFDRLDQSKFIFKGVDVSRILGKKYLEHSIEQLGLKRLKVPKKFTVLIEGTKEIAIYVTPSLEPRFSELNLYSERLVEIHRPLSREEMGELVTLLEYTSFINIHKDNFMITKEGLYIIDTQYTNFSREPQYGQILKLVHLMEETDHEWFYNLIRQKKYAYAEKNSVNTESIDLSEPLVRKFTLPVDLIFSG